VIVPRNGSVIKIAPGAAEEVGSVPSSVFAVDGKRLVVLDGKVIKERKKLLLNGTVTVTVILNDQALCHQSPVLSSVGIFEEEDCDLRDITNELEYAINDTPSSKRRSDQFITEMVEKILRRVFRKRYEKRPVILVHLVRI
jgi:ribonuclease J